MALSVLELNKLEMRMAFENKEVIKVVYLGTLQGWHYGTVLEAKARHVQQTGKKFPYPKNRHRDYRISDEDGDYYTISVDGIEFLYGWYPVPDSFEVGKDLTKEWGSNNG